LHQLFEVVQNAMVYLARHASKSLRVTAKSLSLQSISTNCQSITSFLYYFVEKKSTFVAEFYAAEGWTQIVKRSLANAL